MKSSRDNILFPAAGGGRIIYNTLRGSLTSVDSGEVADVEDALCSPQDARSTVVSTLVQQGHLVDDDVDELDIVRRRRAKGIGDRQRLDVVVMPTLDCNFDCGYCYEQHTHGVRMTPATERSLVLWMGREIPPARLVMLHFFGGEPLYDVDLVCRLAASALEIASSCGTHVAFNVTTNGFLLTGWRRSKLLDAGICDFQVTMDGPARTHDLLRPLAGGKPSFAKVFNNVIDTARADDRVRITLRVNVNHVNIDAIEELLVAFPMDVRPRLRLALEPIFGDDLVAATKTIAPVKLSARLADLYATGRSLGYDVSASSSTLLTGRLTYCYAERERQVVISPTGSTFKCAAGSFAEEDRIGELADDGTIRYTEAGQRWAERGERFSAKCEACAYLPLCMGGCRKEQMATDTEICTLVPTNAAYVLKQVALTGVPHALLDHV